MQIDVHNTAGEVVGQTELDDTVWNVEPNIAVMHQALLMQQANARLGTHDTKTRAEAVAVFDDDFAIDEVDDDPVEARFRMTGVAPAVGIVVVIYTERGKNRIRIISARRPQSMRSRRIVRVERRAGKYVEGHARRQRGV